MASRTRASQLNVSAIDDELENLFLDSDSDRDIIPDESDSDYENSESDSEEGGTEEVLEENENVQPNRPNNRPRVSAAALRKEARQQYDATWSTTDTVRNLQPFIGLPGMTFHVENNSNEMHFLERFVPDELLELICTETNLYASQFQKTVPRPLPQYSTADNWKNISLNELKHFLGLMLLTGIIKKPTLKMYWCEQRELQTPIFPATMTRLRFISIMKFLHFSNNEGPEDIIKADRLYKLRPVIDHLSTVFQSSYVPEQNLSLDEGMFAWRGRLKFRVYNPGKIVKYGIMARMVCESQSGYILTFQIYDGDCGSLKETIFQLLEPYQQKWYHVFQDNYYNSVSVAEELLEKKILVCGTIRQNRGLPDSMIAEAKNLRRGDSVFRRRGEVLMVCWKDKRIVRMISTLHEHNIVDVQSARRQEGRQKPECISDYNKYMHGVDNADQYLSYYPFARKSLKWYKKLFFYLLQCAIFNAYVMFKKSNPRKKATYLDFQIHVGTKLLAAGNLDDLVPAVEAPSRTTPVAKKRAPSHDPDCRLDGNISNHKMVKFPPTQCDRTPTRKCRVCLRKKIKRETRFQCTFCGVPLHPNDCFNAYHTLKRYFR